MSSSIIAAQHGFRAEDYAPHAPPPSAAPSAIAPSSPAVLRSQALSASTSSAAGVQPLAPLLSLDLVESIQAQAARLALATAAAGPVPAPTAAPAPVPMLSAAPLAPIQPVPLPINETHQRIARIMNSCRPNQKPLDENTLSHSLEAMQSEIARRDNQIFYLRVEEEGFIRSVIGTKEQYYILMSRSKKQGDHVLGQGSFKRVTWCVRSDGKRRVVAIFRTTDARREALAEREIYFMKQLIGVKGVVQLETAYKTDRVAFLIMEDCTEGDLLNKIQKGFQGDEALDITIGITEALAAVHAKGILHRDLKPQNTLLTRGEDGALQVRIADFGLACSTSDQDKAERSNPVGTKQYYSRDLAQWYLNPKSTSKQLEKITTFKMDLDALGYLLSAVLAPKGKAGLSHLYTNYSTSHDLLRAIAQLSDPACLAFQLQNLEVQYRAPLFMLFNDTEKDLMKFFLWCLKEIKKTPPEHRPALAQAAPAASAAAAAPARQSPVACGPDDNPMALAVPTPAAPAALPAVAVG